MRIRPIIATLATAGVAIAALPAHASTKTLDGKSHKSLSFTDKVTAPQDNDKDFVGGNSDRTACSQPRCAKFTFIYKPARGVRKGPLSVRIAWTAPVEDYDLYVLDNGALVAQCGAGAGTSEVAVVSEPVSGHKYTIVIDHYRAIPDTVTATATFPAKNSVKTTVPPSAEAVEPINCGLS
jgi:hypothetical protein